MGRGRKRSTILKRRLKGQRNKKLRLKKKLLAAKEEAANS